MSGILCIRGEPRSSGRGGTEATAQPWSWDGAAGHLRAGCFSLVRGTGFGGCGSLSTRTLEVKKQNKTNGVERNQELSFILSGSVHMGWVFFCLVKPCNFSLYPTRIYVFLGYFSPSLPLP